MGRSALNLATDYEQMAALAEASWGGEIRIRGQRINAPRDAALPARAPGFEPCMGLFLSSSRFLVFCRFFVRSGKAVLRSLIAPQVAREFFPLEAFLLRGLSIGVQKGSLSGVWAGLSR
jgi:hypothetical protein